MSEQNLTKTGKKSKKSTIFNIVLITVVILAVILVIILNGDIEVTWNTLIHANLNWVLAAFGCWVGFVLLDAFFMQAFFIQQGIRIGYHHNIYVALIGMFYSNVTPAATGGQPMQVMSLKRRGVNPGISSTGVAVKFFCWQLALLMAGTALWIFNPDALDLTGKPIAFIVLGYLLNGAAVAVVFLLALRPRAVTGLINFVLKAGSKLHLIKNPDATRQKMEHSIDEFNSSVDMIKNHPFQLIRLIMIEILQVVSLMSITYFVYRAVGLSEVDYLDILTIQTLLYITVSFFPLPGAAGAQEIGFSGFFKGVFGETCSAAMLIWRFFTYYIMILLGLVGVVEDSVAAAMHKGGKRERIKKTVKGAAVEKQKSDQKDP